MTSKEIESYELVVIGSGAGGAVAASLAAQKGVKTALIEKSSVGGTCLHWGCVPIRNLKSQVEIYREYWDVRRYIAQEHVEKAKLLNWAIEHRQASSKMAGDLTGILEQEGVHFIYGKARLTGPNQLEVMVNNNKQLIHFEKLIIATGSEANLPQSVEMDREVHCTSDDLLRLFEPPESLIIIGAGAIGCEFASIFSVFDTKVTLIEREAFILPKFDYQIGNYMARVFNKLGVEVLTGEEWDSITLDKDKKCSRVELSNGQVYQADRVLFALGRSANFQSLNLESGHVDTDRFISVNEYLQTANPDVYAIGDVNGIHLQAHSAGAQAEIAVWNAFHEDKRKYEKDFVPVHVASTPEVAVVGIDEEVAKEKGIHYTTNQISIHGLAKGMSYHISDGFIKLIAEKFTGRLLGATIVGKQASELIGLIALTLKMEGTVEDLASVAFPHPTLSESISVAAQGLREGN